MPHKWTDEQVAFVTAAYRRVQIREIVDLVNTEFSLSLTERQVRGLTRNRRIHSGRTGQFVPAMAAWNTGTKGVMRPNSGSFQAGRPAHKAHNYLPIGSLRFSCEGYLERKITDDPHSMPARRWEFEHRIIYKETHGPIPDGHVVVFLDGDPLNLELENLRCVPRAVLATMNARGLSNCRGEQRKAGVLTCELEYKAKQREAA